MKEIKNIAFKVIQELVGGKGGHFAMKYFPAWMVVTAIKDHTTSDREIKRVYNQVRRALVKLGYRTS